MLNSAKLGYVGLYKKNSIDTGALYKHFNYVTKHLLYIKTLNISPIHRADLQGYVYPFAPIGR